MADMTEPLKEAAPYIDGHLRHYIESNGADGAVYQDHTALGGHARTMHLVLKTVGRKSGLPRLAPLICKEVAKSDNGAEYIVIASKMGDDADPLWFVNMRAGGEVAAQVGPKRYRCTWRAIEGEERQRLWDAMEADYPPYAEYRARTGRVIPVVVLTPVGEISEPFEPRAGDGVNGGVAALRASTGSVRGALY